MNATAWHGFKRLRGLWGTVWRIICSDVAVTQVAFLLPTLIIALLYFSIIFLHVYRYRRPLRDAYARDFWDGARYTLALLWTGHGRVWHGERRHGHAGVL